MKGFLDNAFSSFRPIQGKLLMDGALIANLPTTKARLHGCVFKSLRFHIVVFSNISTLVCVFKCLNFYDRFYRFRVNRRCKRNDILTRPKATITWCDLSPRFFCIDAILFCKFESDKK